MKTTLLKHLGAMALLLLTALSTRAQDGSDKWTWTEDKFVVSDFTSSEGLNYFNVSLNSAENRTYCAYNMTVTLPVGISFDSEVGNVMMDEDGEFYPKVKQGLKYGYVHLLSSEVQTNQKDMKAICSSQTNTPFTASSGSLFYVFIKPNAWAKAGENEIRLTGLNLTTSAGEKYVPTGDLNTGTINIPAGDREVEVKFSEIGTCILPFAVAELPEGVKAYKTVKLEGDELILEKVASLEAYKPYILYNNGSSYEGTWKGTADAEAFPGTAVVEDANGLLCGVIETTTVSAGYIMQNKGDGSRFYKIGDTPYSLKPGKCYLKGAAAGGALRMRFTDLAGIETVNAESAGNGACYNLSGQRVATPQPGSIYIINGKKIIK